MSIAKSWPISYVLASLPFRSEVVQTVLGVWAVEGRQAVWAVHSMVLPPSLMLIIFFQFSMFTFMMLLKHNQRHYGPLHWLLYPNQQLEKSSTKSSRLVTCLSSYCINLEISMSHLGEVSSKLQLGFNKVVSYVVSLTNSDSLWWVDNDRIWVW